MQDESAYLRNALPRGDSHEFAYYKWDAWYYPQGWRNDPEPQPKPRPGERVSLENFTHVSYARRADATHVILSGYSDYSGSDCDRSNVEAIRRDFPRSVVTVYGSYGYEALAVSLRSRNAPLIEAILGLAEYPLYDESHHSEMEMADTEEAYWDSEEWDIYRALTDPAADGNPGTEFEAGEYWEVILDCMCSTDRNAMTGTFPCLRAHIHDWFFEYYSETGSDYPRFETATTIYFPCETEAIANVKEHLIAWLLQPFRAQVPGQLELIGGTK